MYKVKFNSVHAPGVFTKYFSSREALATWIEENIDDVTILSVRS